MMFLIVSLHIAFVCGPERSPVLNVQQFFWINFSFESLYSKPLKDSFILVNDYH